MRTYKKKGGRAKRAHYDPERVKAAVRAVARGMSYEKAAENWGVDKMKIYRAHKGIHQKKSGGQQCLSEAEEAYIVSRLETAASWGFPLDLFDVRVIVKAYLDRSGKTLRRFRNNLPGEDWAGSFLKRHKQKLSRRICENIKRSRAAVSRDVVNQYFDNLDESLNGMPDTHIINYDETNFADDPGKKIGLVRRGSKHPERVIDHGKQSTSVMMACTADGKFLPPYVVYKAEHVYDTWTQNGPDGARYNRSKSGWVDNVIFQDWFLKVALPYFKKLPKEDPKALIGDNLAAHISTEVVDSCEKNNIKFILLPANSTHLTQPLDVSVFRPMKRHWRQIVATHKQSNKTSNISKADFPGLLRKVLEKASSNDGQNIRSGFRKCGISPLNRNEVLELLPDASPADHSEQHMTDSFVEFLREARTSERGQTRVRQRKNRLKVVPGKSVTGVDANDDADITVPDEDGLEQMMNLSGDGLQVMPDEATNADAGSVTSSDSEPDDWSNSTRADKGTDVIQEDIEPITLGDFVVVSVSGKAATSRSTGTSRLFMAQVQEVGDIQVSFMKETESGSFRFPDVKDLSWIRQSDIVAKIRCQSFRRGLYFFGKDVLKKFTM